MARELLYLDSSALVKLIQPEPETDALLDEVARWDAHVTSVVGAIEVRRAARRVEADDERVDDVLSRLSLLGLDDVVRDLAGRVGAPTLRTLDAVHLSSALSLGAALGALACYDERLGESAAAEGIELLAPGR